MNTANLRACSGLTLAVALIASTCLAQTPPAAAPKAVYSWTNVDIRGGGFVPGVVFHPTQKGLVYARTDIGGAYRYDQATDRWAPLLDFLGHDDAMLNGVLSIGLDPQNPDRLYLACGEYTADNPWNRKAALLISNDRGHNFDKVELPFYLGGNEDGRSTGERLQVDPHLGSTLFLGTSKAGLWTSTDSGRNWAKTALPASHVLFVLFAPGGASNGASATLYAGVEDRDGKSLYVSNDAGKSWNPVKGTPRGLMPHHGEFGADGRLYLTFGDNLGPNGVTDGAVKVYDPSKGDWSDITPLKPGSETFGYAGLSLDRHAPGVMVVSTLNRWGSGDEIFRSADYGRSWSPVSKRSHFHTEDTPWLLPFAGGSHDRIGHWIGDIDIDPFDSSRVFYVTGYGLWENRTFADVKAPLEWRFTNAGLEETATLELISPPQGAPLISALGDIGGFRHDDLFSAKNSTYFVPNGTTTRGLDFAELKPDIMVRTSDKRPYGYYSLDGGKSWAGFASAPPTIVDPQGNGVMTMGIAINADATRLMWIPAKSEPYVSSDMGRTWVKSQGAPVNTDNHLYPVSDRINPNRFYLYDNRKKTVHYSEDGGATFRLGSTSIPDWGSRMRATPGQEGHLWLGGWNGLNVSDDGGKTFSGVPGFQQVWAVTFGKPAPDENYPTIFVWGKSGDKEGVYMSPDLGARWIKLTTNAQKFGAISVMTGDPRVFGRVYLGVGGRGIMVGDFKLKDAEAAK